MSSLQQTTLSHSTPSTIYFGYGSNLWLHQMHIRCPESTYLGIARLSNYHWIINERGYANVVESSDSSPESASKASSYANVVFGLVYSLSPCDEARLDRNEGVPVAYTKEKLECDFWKGTTETKVDTKGPADEKVKMLVYIDRQRTAPDEPREEYIYRMNQGITDAVKMGVPKEYVNEVMRKYIPAEHHTASKSIEDFAKGQAVQFKDESGVFK
ncbi:hypothetical protein LEMA_P057030.1 [Plenodomus lingam JN3]|uniref:gamma-glutamylcyclotransferase n=2 Tax=Leptosphaeria maculans TaxID=5022 RepID=E4ZH99_LEPMJ|nr:hypothetical protein LEMA_P057030.1 [Plenodomus lingam JN3]CBX90669.1 hypothetical protein LEMA_P057030.1 [Plenodomus lingam JN3]